MGEMRNCSRCGTQTDSECPECLDWFENRRPDPATMTPSEREKELRSWDRAEIEFNKICQRINELVGRPVFTHEMCSSNWENLIQEARERSCELPSMEKVTKVLTDMGKDVIVLGVPDEEE